MMLVILPTSEDCSRDVINSCGQGAKKVPDKYHGLRRHWGKGYHSRGTEESGEWTRDLRAKSLSRKMSASAVLKEKMETTYVRVVPCCLESPFVRSILAVQFSSQ